VTAAMLSLIASVLSVEFAVFLIIYVDWPCHVLALWIN